MGLELPLALLGLMAGLLPILAHRVRRKDLPTLAFPTLELLREAQADSRSRRSWTDLLLLAVRVALIVLASLALAAPYVTAHVPFGDGRAMALALVVDDSMSMAHTDGAPLEAALERASSAIASLPEGSEVTVVLGSQPPRTLVPLTTDLAEASQALEDLGEVRLAGTDLPGAALLARQQLHMSQQPRRHLFVLSDFAGAGRLVVEDLQADGLTVQVERAGPPAAGPNYFFGDINASADPTQPGMVSLNFEVRSDRKGAASVTVQVHGAKGVVDEQKVELSDGLAKGIAHVPEPAEGGPGVARLAIASDDAMAIDNQAGVMLFDPSVLRVLLVNGEPRPATRKDELYYLRRALRTGVDRKRGFRVGSVDAQSLRQRDLQRTDVVVLANVDRPPAKALVAWVRAGGGLIVTAGSRVRAERYNTELGEVLPGRIRSVGQYSGRGLQGPLKGLQLRGLDGVEASRRLVVEPDGEVIASFDDGVPAVVERAVEGGRTVLLALPVDTDWSDLPLSPGYVALMWELVSRAGRLPEPAPEGEQSRGRRVSVPTGVERVQVLSPSGLTTDMEVVNEQLHYEPTEPGVHRVFALSQEGSSRPLARSSFVAHAPATEGVLTANELPHAEGDPGEAKTGASRVRRSLSPYLLYLMALLAFCEGILRIRPGPRGRST